MEVVHWGSESTRLVTACVTHTAEQAAHSLKQIKCTALKLLLLVLRKVHTCPTVPAVLHDDSDMTRISLVECWVATAGLASDQPCNGCWNESSIHQDMIFSVLSGNKTGKTDINFVNVY